MSTTITIEPTEYDESDASTTAYVARAKARIKGVATLYDEDCEHDIISDTLHFMAEKYGEEEAMLNLSSAIRNYEAERRDLLAERGAQK